MAAAAVGGLAVGGTTKAGFGVPSLPTLSSKTSAYRLLKTSCQSVSKISTTSSVPGFSKLLLAPVRASSTEETTTTFETEDLLATVKEKWDAIENKSSVAIYGGGALLAVWISSIVVGAINSVPLLPKVMELVGLGYTVWFGYRYLLFKSNRRELAQDIEEIKRKITGSTSE
eukprot:TRINITY_DN872_c0_g1_i1.p1 TRINITY_DN872_c0_g1~~TRINITY_DN872_c0_g1_i1.p1  ORF type:complete len:172 (+),score=31.96 TRINITY_DN872_c0_g1_i1:136-651(+)